MKLSTAYKVIKNLLQSFDFPGMVIFRRKNICGISTENCVLCSFEMEKDPIFRICAIRMDLRVKSVLFQTENSTLNNTSNFCLKKIWSKNKFFGP
jgi:hypothetical protein